MSENATALEITLGDGTVVKAENMDEAFKVVAKMKEDTALYAKQQKERADGLEYERAVLAAQIEANRPQHTAKGGFDTARYYDLLNTDPVAAQNFLDSHRFGIPDPNQVPQTFIGLSQQVTAIQQQNVSASFLAQHAEDFPQDREAVRKLSERVKDLVTKDNFSFGVDTLNYAYQSLIGEGAIKPLEKKPPTETATYNPPLRGSGGSSWQFDPDTELKKFTAMTTPDQEKYLRAKGMLN